MGRAGRGRPELFLDIETDLQDPETSAGLYWNRTLRARFALAGMVLLRKSLSDAPPRLLVIQLADFLLP